MLFLDTIVSIMPLGSKITLPSLGRLLRVLGQNIKRARLRRKLSAQQVAERAGITRVTLRRVEGGNSNVAIGSYLKVLHVLGLHGDIEMIGREDEVGRKILDAGLEVKRRAPKKKEAE